MHEALNLQANFVIYKVALSFRSEKFLDFDIVALSFLFDKHCPFME